MSLHSNLAFIYLQCNANLYITEISHILPVYSWGPPNPIRKQFYKMRANGVFHPFIWRSLSEQGCLLNSNSQPQVFVPKIFSFLAKLVLFPKWRRLIFSSLFIYTEVLEQASKFAKLEVVPKGFHYHMSQFASNFK